MTKPSMMSLNQEARDKGKASYFAWHTAQPQPAVTLEAIKQLLDERFITEREHTRQTVEREVTRQFTSFIEHSFMPTMQLMDRHFDVLEDHLDRLDIDVANIRTDTRHIKQVLQIQPRSSAPA